ncbi:DUF2961 domain-containing protein [bacterium]|nr:DUF2961 domain-containing protein [bacterium]
MHARIVPLILAVLVTAGALAAETVTTGTLLSEMTDLARLREFPDPAYDTVQFSSYDRTSQIAGGPGWFANNDGFGRERIPAVLSTLKEPDAEGVGHYVIAEVDGPGAIVRLWTALIDGRIELYLDGAKSPVYSGGAEDFLMRLYPTLAKAHGLPAEGYANSLSQRMAGYYPVPFARKCRIVWIGRLARTHFYQIQIRRYEPGARVRTFRVEDLTTYKDEIARAQKYLADPSAMPAPAGRTHDFRLSLPAGTATDALTLEGTGAIARLTLQLSAQDMDRALRQTVLRVSCDGYSLPQVDSPVGDFFGAGPGVNPYDSIPMKVETDGTMVCRFVMPYQKSARIRLENRSGRPVEIRGAAIVNDSPWSRRSMYLFARWRANHGLSTARGPFDVPFVVAHGAGRFVGAVVYLMNPTPIPTPGGGWWGEGDEKIFVDNEAFPSTFGTGSEDYFNYAWSSPDIFKHAYFAQPRCDGPGTRGFIVNSRWHVLDDLPFKQNLAFFMELLHHTPTEGFSYARMGYYYGKPGTYDEHVPMTDADLELPQYPVGWEPLARGGADRGIIYQCEALPCREGTVVRGELFAGARAVQWVPSREGDTLNFKINVAQPGRYSLHLVMQMSPDAGRFGVSIDGTPLGGEEGDWMVDLFEPYLVQLREFAFQRPIELSAGEHTLTLVYKSRNPDSKGPIITGDFLWLRPVERRR